MINSLVITKIEGNLINIYNEYANAINKCSSKFNLIDYFSVTLSYGETEFHSMVEKNILDEQITHVFFFLPSGDLTVSTDFLRFISQRCYIVFNFFDSEYFFDSVDRYYAQFADLVITTDYFSSYKFQQLGINAISTGALYDTFFYRDRSLDRDIDVSFIGNLNQSNRREYVDFLISNGVDIKCYGAGTENGFVEQAELNQILSRSKISLNFSGMFDFSHYSLPLPRVNQNIKQIKGRINEISLSGALLISEWAPGIDEFYKSEEEALYFFTKEELLFQIKKALSDDELRFNISAAGYKHAIQEFDVNLKFSRIIQDFPAKDVGERKCYFDDAFYKARRTYLYYYTVRRALKVSLFDILKLFAPALLFWRYNLRQAYFLIIRAIIEDSLERPAFFSFLKRIKKIFNLKSRY